MPRSDRIVVATMVALAILCATPGVHLLELWMTSRLATLVSHGVALVGLALAAWQWRVRHHRAARSERPA